MKGGPGSVGERLYRLMLRLAARDFRGHYGADLLDTLRRREAEERERGGSALAFWIRETTALIRAALLPGLLGALRSLRPGGLMQDVRFALRALRRRRGFAAAGVALLGLGIGLTTALYGVLAATLLAPLPYPEAERLVILGSTLEERGWEFASASIPELRDVEATGTAVEVVGIMGGAPVTLTANGGQAERVEATFATSSYLSVLGAEPLLGRTFGAEADVRGAGVREVVVGEAFWRTRLGGRRDVLGERLELSGESHVIVGVLPGSFRDLSARWDGADLWLPLSAGAPYFGADMYETRATRQYLGVARLAAGVDRAAAQSLLSGLAARLETEYPVAHGGRGFALLDAREFFFRGLATPLVVLFAGATLVLVLAAVNVAGLSMVRGAGRARELAVRGALGAGRGRILQQLVIEAGVLAALGGTAGVALAYAAVAVAPALIGALPAFVHVAVDGRVLLAALVAVCASGLLFGLWPAIRMSAGAALGARGVEGGPRDARGRTLLIASEVALGLVLTVGAGLSARSLHRLAETRLGYDASDLVTARLDLGRALPDADARVRLVDALVEALGALPEVGSVTVWGPSMLGSAAWHVATSPPGMLPSDPTAHALAQRLVVTPGGLGNLGIPLLRGREFTPADGADAPPVVIIDERLARAFWPDDDALGRELPLGAATPRTATVVGIAAEARHRGRAVAQGAVVGDVYLPYAQFPWREASVLLRVRGDPGAAAAGLRRVVADLAPGVAVADVSTMADRLGRAEETPRLTATLMTLFAAVAVLLAVVGIYGVLSFAVRRRSREIAIRGALGARRVQVVALVFRQGLGAVLAGLASGVLLALAAGRAMDGVLYGVEATDPLVYGVTTVLLGGVASAACLVPALRAARLDPMAVLRDV